MKRGGARAHARSSDSGGPRPAACSAHTHEFTGASACSNTHALNAPPHPTPFYRVTASTAQPVPVAPPPTTSTSNGSAALPRRREAHMSALEGGFSRSSMRTICEV